MLSLLLMVLAAPPAAPEIVLAGKRYALTPVAEPLVVRTAGDVDDEVLRAGGAATRALDDLVFIEGARSPGSLAHELVSAGAVDEVLAAFELPDGTRIYADRRVRVRFAGSMRMTRIRTLVERAGGTLLEGGGRIHDVLAASPEASLEVAARLRALPEVLWASPDFIMRATFAGVPNDPLFPAQWHHEILDSAAAWDMQTGDPGVIIAILDSGVDASHPDLADKIVSPRDTLRGVDGAEPSGNDAHGTACAGLAAAITNNATGIAGICPGCSIMPVRLLDQNGFTRTSAGSDGVRWAVARGARVLSNSWGVTPISDELSEALSEAAAAGVLILFASGNDGAAIGDQAAAAHPAVRAIGATNGYDTVAPYSNSGPQLLVTAPAGSVVTDIADRRGYTSGAYFTSFAGTSASTPIVAGLAGLVWSAQPGRTADEIVEILTATADKIGKSTYVDGRNDLYGYGRVNARRAVLVAAGLPPCTPAKEDCGNGVDDDCDDLVDTLDPACAPLGVPIGGDCTHDFQCGLAGYCLGESLGFPGGYCSTGCAGTGSSCPGSAVCVGEGFTTGSSCHLACQTDGDCRAGYQCLPIAPGSSTLACLPSCNLSPCLDGETCNAGTGVCEHDGPSPVGGSCMVRSECAGGGRCLLDAQGFRDGMCVTECQDTGECPSGTECFVFGAGSAFCLPTCRLQSDCREFYTCHPVATADGASIGYCWVACLSASDCGYKTCNQYGLCGNEHPPSSPPPTTKKSGGGCTAADGGMGAMLAGLLVLRRRRRALAR